MTTRRYEMSLRNRAKQHTREAILDAAVELFAEAYFDEVTLGDVARKAEVSQQTITNHFGSKSELYLRGVAERWGPAIEAQRATVKAGDVGSIVATICADYEETGLSTLRGQALAERFPELAQVMRAGQDFHRGWVAEVFDPLLPPGGRERERLVTLLSIALEVRTWAQLRHDARCGRRATREHLEQLVSAIIGK
jgi:AcrR family transcriptional regulator